MSLPAVADKIQGRHRDRLAVIYVRQSTLQQVGRHPEATRLQYALAGRAQQLGWAGERVVQSRATAAAPARGTKHSTHNESATGRRARSSGSISGSPDRPALTSSWHP